MTVKPQPPPRGVEDRGLNKGGEFVGVTQRYGRACPAAFCDEFSTLNMMSSAAAIIDLSMHTGSLWWNGTIIMLAAALMNTMWEGNKLAMRA